MEVSLKDLIKQSNEFRRRYSDEYKSILNKALEEAGLKDTEVMSQTTKKSGRIEIAFENSYDNPYFYIFRPKEGFDIPYYPHLTADIVKQLKLRYAPVEVK